MANQSDPVDMMSDEEIVWLGGSHGDHGVQANVEMMRRLKAAVESQTESSRKLGARLERLNQWLLVFSIVIFLLVIAQVYFAWKASP